MSNKHQTFGTATMTLFDFSNVNGSLRIENKAGQSVFLTSQMVRAIAASYQDWMADQKKLNESVF